MKEKTWSIKLTAVEIGTLLWATRPKRSKYEPASLRREMKAIQAKIAAVIGEEKL